MPEINLLGNQITEEPKVYKTSGTFSVVVLGIILAVLIAGGVLLYILTSGVDKQVQSVTAENNQIQTDLDKQQASLGNATNFQAQLANIKTLLNNHVYLSQLMDELDKVTYIKAQYTAFDVDNKTNSIHLQGNVTNYNDLSKLLLGLSTSTNFHDVRLLSTLPSPTNSYLFSIDLKAAPQLFIKK